MIGNIAYVAGGTGSVVGNWYQITGQSTGVSITVDRSTGLSAGTGVTINIGGALATPGVCTTVAGGIGGVFLAASAESVAQILRDGLFAHDGNPWTWRSSESGYQRWAAGGLRRGTR